MEISFTITNCIIAVTCLTSYIGFTQPDFFERFKFYPYAIARDESYFRFLSSGFLHGDFMHLLFNMMTLYSLGSAVEMFYMESFPMGMTLFILLYFSGIAAASYSDYVNHQNNAGYAAIGASGGTSAVIFAFVFFQPWAKLSFFFLPPMPAVVLGGLYLVFSTYMAKRGDDNIGHSAHFWGGVYGFVFTCILASALRPELLEAFINQMHF
jgi:membrane associated rhomboid family serine protease